MRGAYLGVHVRHESGADLAGLSLADIHLLDVQLVRLLVLVRLDHLADAHVDELLDALGGLGGLVGHRAHGDARGGRARGAARHRAQGRGGGDGVHGAEGESHRAGVGGVCRDKCPSFVFEQSSPRNFLGRVARAAARRGETRSSPSVF
jgi:hypothetical protein